MTTDLGNGVAIARLLAQDGMQTVGHLYRWETGDLGILWTGTNRQIAFLDRVLDAKVLCEARSADSARLAEFLLTLPVK